MTRRLRIPSKTDTPVADVFCTDDLALATVLCMQGYDTSGLERIGTSRQAEWKFDRDDQLDQMVRDYNSGTHRVEPRQFMSTLKRVRKQLYSFLDGGS
jgi:hypothetical protein